MGVDDALFYTAFPGATPTDLTYDQRVALTLNEPLVWAVRNFHAAVAGVVSLGDPLPDSWITAAVTDPREADQWRRWDLRRTLPRRDS